MKIVGFVGEYAGGSDLLECMRPVLDIDQSLYVASKDDWKMDDLRPVTPSSRQYLNLGLGPVEARPGDCVWLAGARFVYAITAARRLRAYFSAWGKYRGGFTFDVGSTQGFEALCRLLYAEGKVAFLNSLYDRSEIESVAEDLVDAISSLLLPHDQDRCERLVLEGLYYRERRDYERLELVREFAVDEGLLTDAKAFDDAVSKLNEQCKEPRLREDRRFRKDPWPEIPESEFSYLMKAIQRERASAALVAMA